MKDRRTWVLAALALLFAFLVALLTNFAFQKSEAHFMASVETRSIAFTLGDWPDSAGLFVEGNPVELTLQTPCELYSESTRKTLLPTTYRGQTFSNVVLLSMDNSRGLHVTIDVEGGILIFNLERPAENGRPQDDPAKPVGPLRFQLTGGSLAPVLLGRRPQHEQLELRPIREENQHLEFSIRLRGNPEPQLNIPLQNGSAVAFQKEHLSQLLPGTATLLLRKPPETRKGDFSLTIKHLVAGSIEDMHVRPKTSQFPFSPVAQAGTRRFPRTSDVPTFEVTSLLVRLSGVAKDIEVQDVSDAEFKNLIPIRLAQWWPSNLSGKTQAVGSLIAGLLAVLLEEIIRRWAINHPKKKQTFQNEP